MKKKAVLFWVVGLVVVLVVGMVIVTNTDKGEVIRDCTVSAGELQATDLTPFASTNITVTPFETDGVGDSAFRLTQIGDSDGFVYTNANGADGETYLNMILTQILVIRLHLDQMANHPQ